MNPTPSPCPRCGVPIPVEAPVGVCPRCALAEAADPSGAGPLRNPKTPALEDLVAAFPGLEFQGFLGAGGMGFVYRVRDRATGEIGALKVLLRDLAADPAFVERFEREARTLARLDHPNIVRLRSWGQTGGFCHLLMEHVEGATLREVLRAGRFSPEQALALVGPLCDALQYAHSQGVLHRDIKPENILLDADGRAKIADFGIAKIVASPGSVPEAYTLTQTGARIGTPHYMAPEQVETPEAVDHRSDIYSLGVVLYELLTGELPLGRFQAPSAKADLDARIDDIVLRALAKERELRQQSAGEVRRQVEGLGSGGRTGSAPSDTGRLGGVPVWLWWTGVGVAWVFLLRQCPELWPAPVIFLLIDGAFQWANRKKTDPAASRRKGALISACAATVVLLPLPVIQWQWVPMNSSSHDHPVPDLGTARTQRALLELVSLRSLWDSESRVGGPSPLPEIPPHLRIDPTTQYPFLILNPSPGPLSPSILAAAPPVEGQRLVLLGDGSVQTVTERHLWRHLLIQLGRGSTSGAGYFFKETPVSDEVAERWIQGGDTVVRTPDLSMHPIRWPLGHVFELAADGVFEPMVEALGALFQSDLFQLDRSAAADLDWVFNARVYPDGGPADRYEKTAIRNGGLLALLAVAAARVGDEESLSAAQEWGRSMWADCPEVLLFRRRLDGYADPRWEEVRIETEDLMKLRTKRPVRLNLIEFFNSGKPSRTNRVETPWPRNPRQQWNP
ncbi:MAG: protein kinase domain-containing protein [Verrucomicrobiota bacterium]